jgi:hypothetical protein
MRDGLCKEGYMTHVFDPASVDTIRDELVAVPTRALVIVAHCYQRWAKCWMSDGDIKHHEVLGWRKNEAGGEFDKGPLRYVNILGCYQGATKQKAEWEEAFGPDVLFKSNPGTDEMLDDLISMNNIKNDIRRYWTRNGAPEWGVDDDPE